MIRLGLDTVSLGRIQLQPSPQLEVLAWLSAALNGQRHPVAGDLAVGARWVLRDPDVQLVGRLLHTAQRKGFAPDFLLPADPSAGSVQFDAVAETAPSTLARQLRPLIAAHEQQRARLFGVALTELPRRSAAGLHKIWSGVVADQWPAMLARLDAHLAGAARDVLRGGVGQAISNVHPRLSWDGSAIQIASAWEESIDLAGRRLTLVPTLVGRNDLIIAACGNGQPFVAYPFRLDDRRGATPSRDPVNQLIGSSRAALLRHLRVPRTTTALSRITDLSPGTVSYHLRVLDDAGLVYRQRRGREVHYQVTVAGQRLAG